MSSAPTTAPPDAGVRVGQEAADVRFHQLPLRQEDGAAVRPEESPAHHLHRPIEHHAHLLMRRPKPPTPCPSDAGVMPRATARAIRREKMVKKKNETAL